MVFGLGVGWERGLGVRRGMASTQRTHARAAPWPDGPWAFVLGGSFSPAWALVQAVVASRAQPAFAARAAAADAQWRQVTRPA
jgi:hypothetical protein